MLYKQDYLSFLTDVRGYSALTARQYGFCLGKFEYWLQLARDYSCDAEITSADICEFMAWARRDCGLAAKSVNLHRDAVSGYFRYCVRFHAYGRNPVDGTQPMRVPKILPQCVLMSDVEAVLANAPSDYEGLLLRAAVLVMCHCGLRVQEVCDLAVDDLKGGYLIVHGKGGKMRSVPCSAQCEAALRQFQQARERKGFDLPQLLVDKHGGKLTRAKLYHRVHAAFKDVAGKDLAHPHALRHTFATFCLTRGITIPQISAWLGHSSYVTTMRYLSIVGHPQNPFDL